MKQSIFNRTFIFLLLALSPSYSTAQKHKTDWEKYGLKGKVKSFSEELYDNLPSYVEFRFPDPDDGAWTEYEFDSIGHLLERETVTGGEPQRKWNYIYNAKGILTEEYTYAKNDTELGYLNYFLPDEKIVYKYDSSGNDIEEDEYFHDGKPLGKDFYSYDKSGNETSQESEDNTGKLLSNFKYKYDDRGNMIEQKWEGYCNGCHPQGGKHIYIYNDKNILVEDTEYKALYIKNYSERHLYRYNDKGDFSEIDTYNPEGKLIKRVSYDYSWDYHDNWIERNEIKGITKRQIEYYK